MKEVEIETLTRRIQKLRIELSEAEAELDNVCPWSAHYFLPQAKKYFCSQAEETDNMSGSGIQSEQKIKG